MKRRWIFAVLASAVATGMLAACGDDDSGGGGGTDGGGADHQAADTSPPPVDSGTDQQSSDGGQDAALTPTTLAKFAAVQGELPEGVAVVKIDGGAATPVVGFAPLGRIVQVLADGGTTDYASFGGNTDFFTLGFATDPAGALYVAVAQTGANPSTLPGIYKVPPGGGTPTVYAIPDALNPFGFVNGLDFNGTDLYATDSQGKIFKVSNLGVTTKWIEDVELAGDVNDCKLGNGFPIGVNGIVHDANAVYVVNTDKGSLLKIANNNGTAGAITVLKKDPALCGADGLALDKDGTFIVAVNSKDAIVRVTPTGAITTLYKGKPLDAPATVYIDTSGATRRLLVTNAAFRFASTDGGTFGSSLVSFPLGN